ncbi:MAG TPA: septal ring lytic transglycosylase RlpA family protein [Opitutaceae bacterium]|jgi:rare lipoprotein A (peptidoglycan hydrolase)|nr:septal ring lytic transglycosylase RlpA family protein [Opitutaceae bacterium]
MEISVPARASYYGEAYRGHPMAWKGRPFDPDALTCASWFYPFGTILQVTSGTKSVLVVVTDRGPGPMPLMHGVLIDLSAGAFAEISPNLFHPLRPGILPVTITRMP